MKRLTLVGRILFAIATIGLGIDQFIFGEFVMGRAPAWPESVPGGQVWAYSTGAVFVAVGIAIVAGKQARSAAILAGGLVFVWALLRHIPVVAASSFLSVEWSNAGKALRYIGGALAVAATLPRLGAARGNAVVKLVNLERELIAVARPFVGLTLIINGAQHFIFTEFVASLIPGWFPGDAVFWTYFGGVALIAGGIGLLIGQTARLAALLSGTMVFSWFWIIHLPRTFASVADGISVFGALATAGSLFVIAGYLYEQAADQGVIRWTDLSRENER